MAAAIEDSGGDASAWQTVKPRRPKKLWMSEATCRDLARQLNIHSLASTLLSSESKKRQAQGYQFRGVISHDEHTEQQHQHITDANVYLPVHNRWKDWAHFALPNNPANPAPHYTEDGCYRCGAHEIFRNELCCSCYYQKEEEDDNDQRATL